MCMNQSHLLCLWKQGSLCHCSSLDSGTPFLGHTGRLLCLRYSRVVSPTWSQTLPPLLLLCLFSWALFSLSPSPMVWVHVWLVFLGTQPSSAPALFVVCTDCSEISPWHPMVSLSGTGAPTELFFSHTEGSAHSAHRRQSRTSRRMLSEPLHSVSSQ